MKSNTKATIAANVALVPSKPTTVNKITKAVTAAAHHVVDVITGNVPEQTPEAIVAAGRKQRRTEAKQADAAVAAKRISDDTQAHIDAAAKTAARKTSAQLMVEAVDHDAAQMSALREEFVATAPPIPTTGYTGPMRALRDRVKAGAYVKAANGQPSCGDEVAQVLGALEPVEVIKACMVAMDLGLNPYLHLNIGQQSMNLRNKLRGQLKRGEIGMGVVREAVEVVMEARPPKAPAVTPGNDLAAENMAKEAAPIPVALNPTQLDDALTAKDKQKARKAKSPRAT